uniref:Uncharacterized protein n=1 Tax=Tetranychus urticae TaxID=32264 RepID=T1KY73_TETUR
MFNMLVNSLLIDSGSINIACGNIVGSLSDLSETPHVLTFTNITFDERVIFGSSLNFIAFNHLIIESCGGSTQATINRRDRLIVDDDAYTDIPYEKSLMIGPNVTSSSLNGCKITSIQSGALNNLVCLRYLEITRNEELDNSFEYIELNMFKGNRLSCQNLGLLNLVH